jgi:hypothetical protein
LLPRSHRHRSDGRSGELPSPKRKRGMSIWDRLELDAAMDDWGSENPRDARQILRGGGKQ